MSGKRRSRRPPAAPARPEPAKTNPPDDAPPAPGGQIPPERLTPEEQMERFAQELKNEDWGHQPC